jgi:hypothetical protein
MKFGYVLLIVGILAAMGVSSVVFPEGVGAILMVAIVSVILFPPLVKNSSDKVFVTRVFFAALGVRVLFGMIIYTFDLSGFFGPDALTYHDRGSLIADYWHGVSTMETPFLIRILSTSGAGWGMHYLVGSIYYVIGKNALAAQALCWVFGAAIGPAVYICSYKIYKNSNVSKFAAIVTAFFPAFVIWSAQLMKDGLIIFLLVVVIIAVLQLQQKFSIGSIAILILAMFGILSLRFYIFYMVAIAVVGSFVIGLTNEPGAILRRTAILLVAGIGLTYLGVVRTATVDLEQYGTLESVQRSRSDLAVSSESGYGDDVDVSTAEGALTAIPVGFAYLMFAPFPWQAGSLRQAFALPETLLWWGMFPLMIAGIVYTIRHRLREAFPILLFSLLLTLAYSIFQGNVGTAYRQRTQIQVFLFMFIAVGWILRKEAKENKRLEGRRLV